ncbi:MAG: hypothetical protein IKX31_00855 [Muribaculaceae bacterium]|nr:hypothetical protein [Muribaculaceae bacterium]
MKKILLTLVCIMATMSTMGLSAQDNAKNLNPGQWKHGLAIGAQWIARDLGFAQAENVVISRTNENYTLDDLRNMYGTRDKWMGFYNKLKSHENESGDLDKLLATITAEYDKGAVIKNGVKKDVEKYNASHTGDEVGQTSAAEPAATEPNGDEATTITNTNDSTESKAGDSEENKKEESGSHGGHGFLYLLSLLGLAAGLIGTFLGMQARKESQAVMSDVNGDINNMQKQIDKLRAAIKGEPIVHDKHDKHPKHDAKLNETEGLAQTKKIEFDNNPSKKQDIKKQEPKKEEPKKDVKKEEPKKDVKKEEPKKEEKIEEKKEEPKREEPKATVLGEPRILFMAKPDEDDNFSRSSSQYEPGNSIFELTTMDGKSGSFTVINKSDAHKLALLMPGDTLTRACSGNNIQSSAGKSRIITDRAGRAQLENGKWHIVVKAIVHYE